MLISVFTFGLHSSIILSISNFGSQNKLIKIFKLFVLFFPDEVDGLLNIDCVYLTVSYWEVKYIPLPCQSMYTAICKPKQPGAQDVIRQCETGNTYKSKTNW